LMTSIRFFQEDSNYFLPHPRKTAFWIKEVLQKEKRPKAEINYIFCTDKYLSKLNKDFLNHSTLTDIITFDNSNGSEVLDADIYISIERVAENAAKFRNTFDAELHRVMIHGVLHLLGFKDKKASEKALMRKKEDACLSLRK
jgi:probable rRNA maturation factor